MGGGPALRAGKPSRATYAARPRPTMEALRAVGESRIPGTGVGAGPGAAAGAGGLSS